MAFSRDCNIFEKVNIRRLKCRFQIWFNLISALYLLVPKVLPFYFHFSSCFFYGKGSWEEAVKAGLGSGLRGTVLGRFQVETAVAHTRATIPLKICPFRAGTSRGDYFSLEDCVIILRNTIPNNDVKV